MTSKNSTDECTTPFGEDDGQLDSSHLNHDDRECSISSESSTVNPSSKSYLRREALRREALRRSQLTATGRGRQQLGTCGLNSAPGAYPSLPSYEVSHMASSSLTPRQTDGRRRSSLLQAKADILTGATSESSTVDDCPDKSIQQTANIQGSFSSAKQCDTGCNNMKNDMKGSECDTRNFPADTINNHQNNASCEGNNLPVALTVDIEETSEWMPAAIEYDVDLKPAVKRSPNVRPMVYCASLFVLCCSIAVVLAVSANRRGYQSRSCSPREFMGIQVYVESFLGKAISTDDLSPNLYTKALDWIMHEDPLQLELDVGGRLLQRFVLATVYFASQLSDSSETSGDDNASWLSGKSECYWKGIVCDSLGQVRSIDMFDPLHHDVKSAWASRIPAELWRLPFLQKVAVPFGTLENIDTPFSHNQGVRQMPKHLSTLNLRGNEIDSNFDDSISNIALAFRAMRSLKYVDLGQNKLTGAFNATSLVSTPQDVKVLLLDNNMLSGSLPVQGGGSSFHNLHRLNVGRNQLQGTIVPSFNALPQLREVMLNDNQFTGALPELDPDSPLVHLEAGNNWFNGSIPESLVSNSQLVHLGLAFNQLNGRLSPPSPQLRHFDVRGNQLSGSLDEVFADGVVASWSYYDISMNRFNGSMNTICNGDMRSPSAVLASDCLDATECTCCTVCCHSITGQCVDML